MSETMQIGSKTIGKDGHVFIVAEVGINHNGSMDIARRLLDEAKNCGADAVKLQTYLTEKRVAKNSPIFNILKECEISFKNQELLFNHARAMDLEIFSTPFDSESVEFLNSINCSCYKIASFDIVNEQLLKTIASYKRPVIISRGMAKKDEIDHAVSIFNKQNPLALLHCISAYPVHSINDLNLRTINALKNQYNCIVGFSDHSIGIEASSYAVAAGAQIIEKHFTLSNTMEGPDHTLSLDINNFSKMVKEIRRVSGMLGVEVWASIPAEKDILQYRRKS
ncbi:MAG: N-acetylneuraminate synthase family protein [Oligoflexia bacterium]|nr:N-acetylneuraminate synthase family protein [Oligoflexia bacterium]